MTQPNTEPPFICCPFCGEPVRGTPAAAHRCGSRVVELLAESLAATDCTSRHRYRGGYCCPYHEGYADGVRRAAASSPRPVRKIAGWLPYTQGLAEMWGLPWPPEEADR